ncbi:hypothetical protein ANN_27599 [Periplaneta americana]|uniref:Uncharacterized protein n=1 Tax=Periplaneta americana TaxID=6978 RepID=A0ABQ8RWD5_PERAM|nr:hypothetical protein ANN_27599 [Periplaneta americana]
MQKKTSLLLTYAEKRKHYKKIIKEKLIKGRMLVEETRNDPHLPLRPKKQTHTYYFVMEIWESHFSNILNKEGTTDAG